MPLSTACSFSLPHSSLSVSEAFTVNDTSSLLQEEGINMSTNTALPDSVLWMGQEFLSVQ